MKNNLLIKNCRLFDAPANEKLSIDIKEGKIKSICKTPSTVDADNLIDAKGRMAVPGFIDVHIHGAGGADILDGNLDALKTISQTVTRYGTTGFLATTVYYPNDSNEHLFITAANIGNNFGGAHPLGIHLEGPFVAKEKRGMIQLECICKPSLKIFEKIQQVCAGQLRMMTIAPELQNAYNVISMLAKDNIIASFGHSAASYEETLKGFNMGINHVTHLFNAMNEMHHRAPGPLLAILRREEVTIQIIADGMHVCPEILKFIFELFGFERTITITDGTRAMGLPDGQYDSQEHKYVSQAGIVYYHDGTLIGTALGLNQLVQRLTQFTNCSLEDAIRTVTINPAKLLGLEKSKGTIEVNKDADIVLLNSDLSVYKTIVSGKVVYSA